ncbi:hypothetical protein HK105_200828 [Polyrhizophydium stewartii]|uniref:Uncharacterized protein n=1 Tax=Polyrhizophydium stewartii TaxID=2732419 RepID=A0ABR4NK48_9FUNG
MFLSSRAADIAHKALGGALIAFSAFGAFNVASMIVFKYRRAQKADRLLEEETSDVRLE